VFLSGPGVLKVLAITLSSFGPSFLAAHHTFQSTGPFSILPAGNMSDDSSLNLSVMAAAAEHRISAVVAAATDQDGSSDSTMSPSRRSKLILPNLTSAMQQDLAPTKGLGTTKSPKPLSICARVEFADYPLQGIVAPHPNDVCK
jgi:hypothetical protein